MPYAQPKVTKSHNHICRLPSVYKCLLWLLLLILLVSLHTGWKIYIRNEATASGCKLLNPIHYKRSCPIDQIPSEQTGWELTVSRACKDMKISWLSLSCQCQPSFTQSFYSEWGPARVGKKSLTQKCSVFHNHFYSWHHILKGNVWKPGNSFKNIYANKGHAVILKATGNCPTDLKARAE